MQQKVVERTLTRSRRSFRPGAAVLLLGALILTACGSGGSSGEETEDSRTDAEILAAAKERPWVVATSGDGGVSGGVVVGSSTGKMSFARAVVKLNEDGWSIDPLFMAATSAPLQALVQGRVDIVSSALPSVIAARAAGAEVTAFGAAQGFDFVMVGRAGLTPEDFGGRNIAYQSAISSGTMAAMLMMRGHESVPANYLTIGGTSTRLAALVSGEIDATAVRIGADTEAIDAGEPGEFEVLYEPLNDYPWLLDSVVVYNDDHLDPEMELFAQAFLRAMVESARELEENPELLDEWAQEHELRSVPSAERLLSILATDVGLSPELIDQQIELMNELGQLDDVRGDLPTGAELVDMSIWEAIEDDFRD